MGAFSYITVAEEDEYLERYKLLKKAGRGLKDFIVPHLPDYIYGTVGDIGISDQRINGCWVRIPPSAENNAIGMKKYMKAVGRCRNFGADVLVVDPVSGFDPGEKSTGFKISRGTFYAPFTFIDAVKTVSALMGIDFIRSNVCIVNALSPMGIIMTELLLGEVSYLTLCTENRDMLQDKISKYVQQTGLSPAVTGNYKKAVSSCDILIYAGGADINCITSYINRKVLIANVTGQKMEMEKDLLSIDEVILMGSREPSVSGEGLTRDSFLTSRMWEGALLTLCNFSTEMYDINKALEIKDIANRYNIKISSVIRNDKPIDSHTIRKYR